MHSNHTRFGSISALLDPQMPEFDSTRAQALVAGFGPSLACTEIVSSRTIRSISRPRSIVPSHSPARKSESIAGSCVASRITSAIARANIRHALTRVVILLGHGQHRHYSHAFHGYHRRSATSNF